MKKILYILGELADTDVEWLIAHGTKQQVAPGTVLIREGQPIDMLYVLLDGTLEVAFGNQASRQPVRLGCGEVVGEMSFVDSRPPSATVTAAGAHAAVVLAVPRARLARKLQTDSAFAARFYRAIAVLLSERLRSTVSRLVYGRDTPLNEDVEYEAELGPDVLDKVHRAGARFDRVLQRLLGE
jgi:bacteriocin-type transport-associated protein